ncbi:MAG TPA: sulfatase, partial [Vicinamibacteria bacterium]
MREALLVAALVATVPSTAGKAADAATARARPNIVFVLVDDLRWDEMDYPFVRLPNMERLAREGVRFANAFVTTPLCSPSRASFLTGQYAHRHGILDNTDRSPRSHELVTFPRLLHDAGYETAFLGKWHMGVDDTARPGFDHWVSVPGQGRYEDPELNVNGERRVVPGYFTDVLNDFATDFLKRPHARPFLLFLAHKAVHPDVIQRADGSVANLRDDTFIPAARHKGLYAGAAVPHRPNYGRPPAGKPALLRRIGELPPLGPDTVTTDDTILKRLRMLQAVDEGLGRLLEALETAKRLDDTLVVLTSDEGFFYGEHGLSEERRLAYEESIRIPLVMRWPKLIAPGLSLDPPVLGLDLAPTLLEIGGAPAKPDAHGRSLVPLLRGEKVAWRDSFLVEYFSDTVFPRVLKMGYQAVRTGRWTYIRYTELEGMNELYDREADPYQMTNRIDDPAALQALRELEAERVRL